MNAVLKQTRLIYLGPRERLGGVGDYAEQFVDVIRSLFADVVEYRHGAPGDDTLADLRRHRKALRDLVGQSSPCRTLVHAELSGGAVAPFWAVAGLRTVPVTATVHDPPELIWWPARTRFMAGHRLINHGVHYPLRRLSHVVQRTVADGRVLFALTESGARSIETTYPRARAVQVPHLALDRKPTRPADERPRAVGFFGLVYRGKGFEQIDRIRQQLPEDILIRVGGRGTETLPAADGIDIVGGIDGAEENAFFDSVRAIVVPYGRRTFYGDAFPSSAVIAHAISYGTPVICSDHGALRDLGEESGAVVLRGLPAESDAVAAGFARAISALVDDETRLAQLSKYVDAQRSARLGPRVAEAFGATWSELLGRAR